MSKTKKSKTFIKIIYFDEGSATDLLYILGGGKSTDKEEKIVTKTTQLAAGAEAQAGAKINLLTKITAGMGIDGSADASREGRSILSKAIESTVLTDYIGCTENEAKSHITVFTKCKPFLSQIFGVQDRPILDGRQPIDTKSYRYGIPHAAAYIS